MATSKSLQTQKSFQEKKGRRKAKFKNICSIEGCKLVCCAAIPRIDHSQEEDHVCRCLFHFDLYMQNDRRDLNKENGGVPTAPSGAMSSFEALFFHDIPPEVLIRLAQRYTGGHRKYGVGHTNLNWRVGLDDPKYIADRFNHMMDHIVKFMEDQNDKDDNLGAAIWNLGFLIVAETRCNKAFREAFCQAKLFGKLAKVKINAIKESISEEEY